MKRNFDLKPRESRNLPPEHLRKVLSEIYDDHTVDELMKRLVENQDDEEGNE